MLSLTIVTLLGRGVDGTKKPGVALCSVAKVSTLRNRAGLLRRDVSDVMRVHELGQQFDAVSFLDAECYLPDKGLAVQRIVAILQPGARLLIVAWCRQGGLSSMQEELVLHPFMRY